MASRRSSGGLRHAGAPLKKRRGRKTPATSPVRTILAANQSRVRIGIRSRDVAPVRLASGAATMLGVSVELLAAPALSINPATEVIAGSPAPSATVDRRPGGASRHANVCVAPDTLAARGRPLPVPGRPRRRSRGRTRTADPQVDRLDLVRPACSRSSCRSSPCVKTPPSSRNSWSASSACQHLRSEPGVLLILASSSLLGLEEVELGRLARIDLVLDAVQTGHQQRREEQVRVRGRVRAAELDPLALRVAGVDRDADRGRAVALPSRRG